MRNLASIQTVNAVEPIANADAIERLRILGWWLVAKKGEHRVGDKVVYCEIDSLLPERAEFEFLRSGCFKPAREVEPPLPAGFRIKTMKFRGQVSQGICFPLSILPQGAPTDEGEDVTEVLGVAKWEPLAPGCSGQGNVRGTFPDFLPKTDETRVQLLQSLLERHAGKTFYVTEKLDGSSFTAFIREGEYGVCSRNQRLDETDEASAFVRVANRLQLERKLRSMRELLGFDVAIQAEMIGPGIQKNKYGLSEPTIRVFNVLNVATRGLLDHASMLRAVADMELQTVPQLGAIELNHSVDDLVALSVGASQLNPKVQREGIVLRPLVEEFDRKTGRLSFKAVNPQFLLKYDE